MQSSTPRRYGLCAAGMRAGDVDPPAAPPATASGRSGALEQVLTLHPSTFPEELYSRTQRRCARALPPRTRPHRACRRRALCRACGASGRPEVTAVVVSCHAVHAQTCYKCHSSGTWPITSETGVPMRWGQAVGARVRGASLWRQGQGPGCAARCAAQQGAVLRSQPHLGRTWWWHSSSKELL